MRKLFVLLILILALSLSAKAQIPTRADLFGGYSYARVDAKPSINLNGWNISLNAKPTSWFGIVGDFGGYYGSPSGVSTSVHTFLFGPQVSFPASVSPFAHVLLGGAHVSGAGASSTSFASAYGGGVDLKWKSHLAFRVAQLDYLMTRFGSRTQNNLRISTGIVLRF